MTGKLLDIEVILEDVVIKHVTPREVQIEIKIKIKPKKSPGYDLITGKAIVKLTKSLLG